MTERPLLVGVGGFLGAGKTTAILAAVERLRATGTRVAVVTNDQASGLVDTEVARAAFGTLGTPSAWDDQPGQMVAEISGGCFCCRFDDLARTLREVIERARPDVILAEAVGSCTDLAATVYQPLRQLDLAPVRLGPLTVVADGTRLRSIAKFGALPRLPADVGYLFGQQLAEADVLLLNKIDQLSLEEVGAVRRYLDVHYPVVPVVAVSALRGEGMGAWLDLLVARGDSGRRVLDLDYDRYAEAEAALGWLNLSGTVTLAPEERAAAWVGAVLSHIEGCAAAVGVEIAHVKVLLATGDGACRGHLAGGREAGDARPLPARRRNGGAVAGEPFIVVSGRLEHEASLTLNARVAVEPETLRRWVEEALAAADAVVGAQTGVSEIACFAPARPVPTYRLQPVAMA